ncbi:hypothetical protein ACFQGS_21785 [Novosphingobium lubricantis]
MISGVSSKNGFFSAEDEEGGVRSQARGAYLLLRSRIIQGDLAPLDKLKIAPLATELDVSSSAVRRRYHALLPISSSRHVISKVSGLRQFRSMNWMISLRHGLMLRPSR